MAGVGPRQLIEKTTKLQDNGNFSISPQEIIGFLEWGLGVS